VTTVKNADPSAQTKEKESAPLDPGMIHSGECTPGCTCYLRQEDHCSDWDPEAAPPCRCREHKKLALAMKTLADTRKNMRYRAQTLSIHYPAWEGRYQLLGAQCVHTPFEEDGCSCTPGGPAGCFPMRSSYDEENPHWHSTELDRLTKERDEELQLALKNEKRPIYPKGRWYQPPLPDVDLSVILADEFAVMFRTELAKREEERREAGGGGGGGGGSPVAGPPPPLPISGPHPKGLKCRLCGEEECPCGHAPPAYASSPPVPQERRAESMTPPFVPPPEEPA
jgi:hypothetical protein